MSKKVFSYWKNCVSFSRNMVDDLIRCIDTSRTIKYESFIKHVDMNDFNQLCRDLGYSFKKNELRIQDDYAVSFHISYFKKNRVYYVRHSSIEYIFIHKPSFRLNQETL